MAINNTIELCSGDIFESDAFVMVNPVNCVGVMGKGLALQYKKKYPAMFRHYRDYCQQGMLHPGEIFNYSISSPISYTHHICNVATKDDWRNESIMPWIEKGIRNIRNWCVNRYYYDFLAKKKSGHNLPDVMTVAIPALGCGEGRLNFEEVYARMEATLCSLSHTRVLVYLPKP